MGGTEREWKRKREYLVQLLMLLPSIADVVVVAAAHVAVAHAHVVACASVAIVVATPAAAALAAPCQGTIY